MRNLVRASLLSPKKIRSNRRVCKEPADDDVNELTFAVDVGLLYHVRNVGRADDPFDPL